LLVEAVLAAAVEIVGVVEVVVLVVLELVLDSL
jgi:hypothetical protein